MKLRALALAAATAATLAGCTPASSVPASDASAPTVEKSGPTVLTGIVTDAAPMGYGYSSSIVEVQNGDGLKTVYECNPGWSKLCSLLRRGDTVSFTVSGASMQDVKRIKSALDTTDPLKK